MGGEFRNHSILHSSSPPKSVFQEPLYMHLKHMYTFMNNDSIVWQLCNILIIIYCMFLTTVFSQYYTCEIYTVHIYICNPLCRFFFFPAQLTIGYFGYFKTFTLPKRSSNEHSGTCHCLRDDLRQCFPIFCSMQ